MLHDPLADAMSALKNAERVGKRECVIRPVSNMIKSSLQVMQKAGYIGEFEHVKDGRGDRFKVSLQGNINDCNTIKPRSSVKKDDFERWEKRFLPAASFGLLVVSTPDGVKSHRDVKGKLGGVLLAYVY